jgi:hypothetical protein
MLNILKLAAFAGVAAQVKRHTAQAAQMALRGIVAATLVVAGLAFLVAAAWLKLEAFYGSVNANLLVGIAFTGAGALVYVLGIHLPRSYKKRYQPSASGALGSGAAPAGLDLSTLATLAAMGVAAGRHFRR